MQPTENAHDLAAPAGPTQVTGSQRVLYVAITGDIAIAISKFVAAAFTASSAMLAEGVHSLVDTGNELLLLHGVKSSRRAVDEVRKIIAADAAVERVGHLLTMRLGPDAVLLTAAVRFQRRLNLDEVEQAIERLEPAIKLPYPAIQHLCLESGALKAVSRSVRQTAAQPVPQVLPQPSQETFMSQYPIAVVVGSLRKESFNRQLADAIAKLAPPEFSFKQVNIGDLPLYNQDHDANQADSVKRLKADIGAARGLLFVTAEYNRSVPGVLKNAIDHASRPYGQSAWAGKPAGVIGVSVGAIGTAMAQQHLRNVLAYLDVPTLGQPEGFIHAKEGLFDAAGGIGSDSKKFLQGWMDHYVAWVKKHSS